MPISKKQFIEEEGDALRKEHDQRTVNERKELLESVFRSVFFKQPVSIEYNKLLDNYTVKLRDPVCLSSGDLNRLQQNLGNGSSYSIGCCCDGSAVIVCTFGGY